MNNSLIVWLDEKSQNLTMALDEAVEHWHPPTTVGDARAATDAFLVGVSQHVSAVVDSLLPQAATDAQRKSYIKSARELERLAGTARARAYGQGQSARVRWDTLWPRIETALRTTLDLERVIGANLDGHAAQQMRDLLIERIASAPTRPHPRIPHQGPVGRMLRRLAAPIDRAWDELQGRPFAVQRQQNKAKEDAKKARARRHEGWNWRMSV